MHWGICEMTLLTSHRSPMAWVLWVRNSPLSTVCRMRWRVILDRLHIVWTGMTPPHLKRTYMMEASKISEGNQTLTITWYIWFIKNFDLYQDGIDITERASWISVFKQNHVFIFYFLFFVFRMVVVVVEVVGGKGATLVTHICVSRSRWIDANWLRLLVNSPRCGAYMCQHCFR